MLLLGVFMILESFGWHLPVWISPVTTVGVVGAFFLKSQLVLDKAPVPLQAAPPASAP